MYLGGNTEQMKSYIEAGHCVRHDEEVASKLVLWEPTEGRRSRGRQKITFIDNLLEDASVSNTTELRTLMEE